MFFADYHTHSINSPDGNETVEQMCLRAIELGLQELAITDHIDVVTNPQYGSALDTEAIHRDMRQAQERFAGQLRVVCGAEIGQPQADDRFTEEYCRRYQHDFLIGSIHNLPQDSDIFFYDYTRVDHHQVYQEYLTELQRLAEGYDFDVMGHITYPLRYMYQQTGKTPDLTRYEGRFRTLFATLIEKGRGIEINTSGLRQPIGELLPPLYLARLYRACGGEIVTVGSDAHTCGDLGCGIREGYEMLREAGFQYVTAYWERKPTFHRL
ncbi:MAG: histidinol-phosphatase HisJ family protein [Eubacteriales bacterium]